MFVDVPAPNAIVPYRDEKAARMEQARRPAIVKSDEGARGQVPKRRNTMFSSQSAALLLTLATAMNAGAATPNTSDTPADTLNAVTIMADRGAAVSRTDTVLVGNSSSITETLSCIPGIQISDNGGAAGLKTLSLRGLGCQSTAIYLDGVKVSNVQSGQPDLGIIDLAGCASAVVDYARNSISFTTAKPVFRDGARTAGAVRLHGGSFGTFEPAARLDFKLGRGVTISASASGTVCSGDFPYTAGDNSGKRENNDINRIRGGIDLRGMIEDGDWHAKAYCNSAERGTPGSIDWPSSDRQHDLNTFAQALVRKHISPRWSTSAILKAAHDELLYESEWGDSRYSQDEFHVNSSHKYTIRRWIELAGTADCRWNSLKSSGYDASRAEMCLAGAAVLHSRSASAKMTLDCSSIADRTDGQKTRVRTTFSPAADIRWSLLKGLDISAFGRRAYRTPTFNELYYPGFGNPGLKPEDAWLGDIGIAYATSSAGKKSPGTRFGGTAAAWSFTAKADAFFNSLKNKIISAPTETDPGIWLPYNVGIVRMAGTDLQAGIRRHPRSGHGADASLFLRYSFQDARDCTSDSAGGRTSGTPLPFIARHSLCASADCSIKNWRAAMGWNMRKGRFDAAGRIPDYSTLDLDAVRNVALKGGGTLALKLIARNITDCRYELASGYPMPGRAFYCGIDFKL